MRPAEAPAPAPEPRRGASPRLVFAYDHRGRQPALPLRHDLRLGRAIDVATIARWLRDHLGIDPAFLAAAPRQPPRQPEQHARALCELALVLYGELLRLCKVPVFDPGRVVQVTPKRPGDWTEASADVVLPVIDHFPETFYAGLYSDALGLIHAYMLDEPSEASVAKLHETIQTTIVDGLAKSSPFLPACLELCQIAHRANLPFRHHGGGVLRFGWGAHSRTYHKAALQADSAVAGAIAYDKQLTARYLQSAGFPVPEHTLVRTPEAALAAAEKHGWHVVLKPADTERSRGVTLGVRTEEKLRLAFDRAREASPRVLVEKHIPGVCHRILVAGGEIVYAVKRNPKGVFGDGESPVRALIERAAAREGKLPPWKRVGVVPADDLAVRSLERAGLTLDSIPAPGEYAPLRPYVSGAWGGTVIDVREELHPRNAQLARDVAATLGLAFAGVDFMTTDIARPWDETGGVINEVNFKPEFATVARSLRLDGLLSVLAPGDGRIPVHLLTGGGDLQAEARALAARLRAQGGACHVASTGSCEDGAGRPLVLAPTTLFDRAIALLMRGDVAQLLLVDEAQALLRTGLPVDRLDSVWIAHPDRKLRNQLRQHCEVRLTAAHIRVLDTPAAPTVRVPQPVLSP